MAGECREIAIIRKENGVRWIREQWCVEYSRFFRYPRLSSTHLTLTPLSSNHRARLRGNWISTSSSSSDCLASLTLLSSAHTSVILLITFRHKILEEHYISKLHFMWPQMTCVSGYPARASRVVLLSYRDNVGQIQKFALRFLTIYDTEKFIKTLKEILEEESVPGPTPNILGSATSSQSECVPPSVSPYRPIKDWGPTDSYPHDLTLSLNLESPKENNIQGTTQNHQRTIENNQVEGILSDYPPSFTSLLMNCYPAVQQAVAEPTASKDAELKGQIVKYLEDASFQDMLIKVEQVINEIGDDMML